MELENYDESCYRRGITVRRHSIHHRLPSYAAFFCDLICRRSKNAFCDEYRESHCDRRSPRIHRTAAPLCDRAPAVPPFCGHVSAFHLSFSFASLFSFASCHVMSVIQCHPPFHPPSKKDLGLGLSRTDF